MLFAVIKGLKNVMDLYIHQAAPKGGLKIYKVFSTSSFSFLSLFVTKVPPVHFTGCLLWRPKCNMTSDKCSER